MRQLVLEIFRFIEQQPHIGSIGDGLQLLSQVLIENADSRS
jgi:hypothetical protein